MRRLFLIISIIATSATAADSHVPPARLVLKKWGFTYCLHLDNDLYRSRYEIGRATEGYFQNGSHDNEAAYDSIRKYFDARINAEKRVDKETGKRNILVACLDAYEDPAYQKVIRAQDKYISSPNAE